MQQQIRGRLTCFCRVWLWCDMANDVMWYIGCMRWSCCNRNIDLHVDGTGTGRSHRVVFILTFVLADAFTILLGRSFCRNSMSSKTTPMATRWWRSWWWRSWCDAGDKKIVPVLWWWRSRSTWWWPYHVTYKLHVMLILLCTLFCLEWR